MDSICDVICDLGPLTASQNVKNSYGGFYSLILVKLQASARNFTKLNTLPPVFLKFFYAKSVLKSQKNHIYKKKHTQKNTACCPCLNSVQTTF